jgi:N-acetylglutamate synthase-like GNAT family acetyltransferase
MTRPRAVRPTDLVALVSFDGRVYPNEAKTRERIGKSDAAPHPLERALEQWFSFATGCHTWISIKGATLRGLVSVRRRGSSSAWELDCLINAAEEDDSICLGLLDQALKDATRSGVEKVFLRLSSRSAILPLARRLDFCAYQHENLFSASSPSIMPHNLDALPRFRRATRSDENALYDLYNACVPENVREAEAATFREWKAAQDRSWLVGKVSQQVAERDGSISAWFRSAVDGDMAQFDLLIHPAEPTREALLDIALRQIGSKRIMTLVPSSASGLIQGLQRRGFERGPEFASLVMRTAVTAKAPQLAPAV